VRLYGLLSCGFLRQYTWKGNFAICNVVAIILLFAGLSSIIFNLHYASVGCPFNLITLLSPFPYIFAIHIQFIMLNPPLLVSSQCCSIVKGCKRGLIGNMFFCVVFCVNCQFQSSRHQYWNQFMYALCYLESEWKL
jgi:hypothetical protein